MKKKKAKPKPKRKWNMTPWVAVPTERLDSLNPIDLGDACRKYLCDSTKRGLFIMMRHAGVSRKTRTLLELDIKVTER